MAGAVTARPMFAHQNRKAVGAEYTHFASNYCYFTTNCTRRDIRRPKIQFLWEHAS